MGGPNTTEQLNRINYTFAIVHMARKPGVTSSINLFLESLGVLSYIMALCKILLSNVYELSEEQRGRDEGGCAGRGVQEWGHYLPLWDKPGRTSGRKVRRCKRREQV